MDRIVRVLAPQSYWQTILLFCIAQAMIGVAAFAYDVGVHRVPMEDYLANVLGTFLVASPFILLVLLMLRHQAVLQDRLARLADTDALTGLLNRRAFLDLIAPGGRAAGDGVLMVADVDRFKDVNDAHGHDAGDRALIALARHLERLVGEKGHVCRLGGDEFVLFLGPVDLPTARRTGEMVAAGVELQCRETRCLITLAVGAVPVAPGACLSEALALADDHMYQAKRGGPGRISCPWDPAPDRIAAAPARPARFAM